MAKGEVPIESGAEDMRDTDGLEQQVVSLEEHRIADPCLVGFGSNGIGFQY